jgi:ABC-type antimicrobial peptide transport system permease subunit
MLGIFLKTSFRNLWKNKTYSLLNIAGLAIGIACAGLIFLWVEDEMNFDSSNQKRDKLYLTRVNQVYDAYTATFSSTPGVMGPALQADIPGVVNSCRITEDNKRLLFNIDNKVVYAGGLYAEPSVFSMFTLPFAQGNAQTAMAQLHSIVLTEATAHKFFGDEKNVVGKTVRVDNKQDYVVSAILKDLPENNSLQFEWLIPFEVYYQETPWARKWSNSCVHTFVELQDVANLNAVNKLLYDYLSDKNGSSSHSSHAFLWNMRQWHLYDQFDNGKPTGSGRIAYVRLFSFIAWIILLIACINFMNLATARSEKRAKEVGVRKVLGAGKKKLILQFICEALMMAMFAAVLAIVIMTIVMPAYNNLVEKNLTVGLTQPFHLFSLLILTLLCGILAGSYPSFYLSSFNPVFVLKGMKIKTGSAAIIRKGLVVLQFTVSIMLIIGTIVIYKQIQHVKSRDLGFNKNNLLQLDLRGDMLKNYAAIKQDLINTGMVENTALTDHETIYDGNNTSGIVWPGKDPNSNILISNREVSPEFIKVAGMHINEGRDFESQDIVEMGADFKPKQSDAVFNVIITESLEKILGKGSAIGKTMQLPSPVPNEFFPLRVAAVVKDYVYGDMYGTPTPVVFYCLPPFTTLMYVRTKAGVALESCLQKIEAVLKKDNPGYPFEYKFVDDQFNAMFMSEMLISKLASVFATLAIIISCLGLFGLAAYTAERRTKEIGVRKVLGASVPGIAALISKDFIKLVFISCLLAFPVSWWAMHNWLQGYRYRIEISGWIFVIAGLAAIFIAIITVSFQAIRAAVANPVKSLRTE